MKTRLFIITALVMAMTVLAINVSAKTKARSKKKTTTTTQATPAKKKLKITNSAEVIFPTLDWRDDMNMMEIKTNEEEQTIKITELTIVSDVLTTEDDEGGSYDEDENDVDEDIEDVYKEEIINDEDYKKDNRSMWLGIITLILDTERDANGNAVRRHIYIYEGKEDALADNGRHIQDPNKIKRLSFPANEAGLEQWRLELIKYFASKNKPLLDEINIYKKQWQNGDINDSIYNVRTKESQIAQVHDLSALRPCVLIKPMGNAESGNVIDVFGVMALDYITTFMIEDVNHNDSVMVFNSLFPDKDMPNGVDLYSYGKIADYPQSFGIDTPEDSLGFGMNCTLYDPAVTIEVKANQQHKGGATAAILLDEIRFKKDAINSCPDPEERCVPDSYKESAKKERKRVKSALAGNTFKQLVKNYGNGVTESKWIEVEPVDPYIRAYKKTDFQKPIYDLAQISTAAFRVHNNNIMIYTDRHTPYSALKCVIDNLRQLDINSMILAY